MASNDSKKRTTGIVSHTSVKGFGFIDVESKSLPVSNVYFNNGSVSEKYKEDFLTQFPPGTRVTMHIVPAHGDNKGKYRAVDVRKFDEKAKSREKKSGVVVHSHISVYTEGPPKYFGQNQADQSHEKTKASKKPNKSNWSDDPPTKVFSEMKVHPFPKTSVPCSDDSYGATQPGACRDNGARSKHPSKSQNPPRKSSSSSENQKDTLFSSREEKVLQSILGDEISLALQREMKSRELRSLNSLILLRLNSGEKVRAKFFDASRGAVINCALVNVGTVNNKTVQKILGNKVMLKKVTDVCYGTKNALHSIRVTEENGMISGLTVFCQLHDKRSNKNLNILQRKRFTAVISDLETMPSKYVFNYLRKRSSELCQDNDVLILDVNGQLTGFEDEPHPSLGKNVSRSSCSNSSDLPKKINDAIQHSHNYVILVNADDAEILQMILKMCSKGTNVIAEVPSELRKDVERIFSD